MSTLDGAVIAVVEAQEQYVDYFRKKKHDIHINEVLSEVSCQQQAREHQPLFLYKVDTILSTDGQMDRRINGQSETSMANMGQWFAGATWGCYLTVGHSETYFVYWQCLIVVHIA